MKVFNFHKYGDKLLFALALVVLLLAVFRLFDRCKSTAAAPRIVFTQWWQDDIGKDTLRNLIEEFESLNGGIKVELNDKPYEELRLDLFNSAFDEANTSPGDVFALDLLWVGELIERNIIEGAEVPILSFINVLYYNIDILKKAGFSRPPKTRGEFLTCARAAAGKKEKRADSSVDSSAGLPEISALGLALGENSSRGIYDDVYPWIWAAGTQLITDGRSSVASRPVVESLSFLATLYSEGLIAPDVFFTDREKKLEDFISGRTAFMISSTKDIGFVRERMGDQAFGITEIPLDNYTKKPLYASTVWTAGVYSGSQFKEEARLFAGFLAGKAAFLSDKAKAINVHEYSPVLPAASPPALDPFYSKVWNIAIAGETAQDFSGLAGEYKLEEIFREELSALFAGESSPLKTAEAIQERWNAIIIPKAHE